MFPHSDKLVAVFVCFTEEWKSLGALDRYERSLMISGGIFLRIIITDLTRHESKVSYFHQWTSSRPSGGLLTTALNQVLHDWGISPGHNMVCHVLVFWSTLNSSKLYCFLFECVCDWTEVLCLPLVAHLVTAQTDLLR